MLNISPLVQRFFFLISAESYDKFQIYHVGYFVVLRILFDSSVCETKLEKRGFSGHFNCTCNNINRFLMNVGPQTAVILHVLYEETVCVRHTEF